MCGRFALKIGKDIFSKQFLLKDLPALQPRYNIAPTQSIVALRKEKRSGERIGFSAHWGLIPHWAKDKKIGPKMINARSESAPEKPAFRKAAQYRRCLIPASGFYEWKRQGEVKQPFYIYPSEAGTASLGGPCFPFAGLWESWEKPESEETVQSVTILTTRANPFMEAVHDRMPVMLPPEQWDSWLDPETQFTKADWEAMTSPLGEDLLAMYPVSRDVNSPRNDSPELIEPENCEKPFQPRKVTPNQGELF